MDCQGGRGRLKDCASDGAEELRPQALQRRATGRLRPVCIKGRSRTAPTSILKSYGAGGEANERLDDPWCWH